MEYDGARGGIASVRAPGLNRSKGLVTRSNDVCFGRGGARRSDGWGPKGGTMRAHGPVLGEKRVAVRCGTIRR